MRIGTEFSKGSAAWHQEAAKWIQQIAWNGCQIGVMRAFRNHGHQIAGVEAPR